MLYQLISFIVLCSLRVLPARVAGGIINKRSVRSASWSSENKWYKRQINLN